MQPGDNLHASIAPGEIFLGHQECVDKTGDCGDINNLPAFLMVVLLWVSGKESGYPVFHRPYYCLQRSFSSITYERGCGWSGSVTATKPVLRVLAGEAIWPPPIWLMRQAGRYLPEYRAVRARVPDFISLCTTPELAAEVTLQPIRRFGFDAAILFSDILIVPWGLGQKLDFLEGEGPVLPPLRDASGIDRKSVV